MKKLLSILICVLISAAAAASWTGTAQLTVYGQTGKGKVYVQKSQNNASVSTPADNVAWTYESKTEGDKDNVNSNTTSAYFAIHAKADARFYFEGWYSDETRTTSRNITAKDYNATVTASSSSGQHEHYYANFAHIISISDIKTEKILAWSEGASLNTSRAKITVPVNATENGDIMTIDIIGSGDDYLQSKDVKLYNADNTIDITDSKQITPSADGTFVFYVGYQGTITDLGVLIQKKIRLKVVAKRNSKDRDWEEFDVTIEEAPRLKFKGTNGKGTYSSNLLSSFDTNSSETHEVAITNTSMLSGVNLSLSTDPTDGEIFLGWKVTKLDGTETLISYQESCTAPEFEGGETIEAVFVPNTCGYIIMNGNAGNMSASNNNIYVDLHSALVDAETIKNNTGKAQFVVLENLSTIFTNKGFTRTQGEKPTAATSATLPNREGGYTIPAGITLLIPADQVYNYCLGEMSKDYYSGGSLTQYRKLVVEKGTQITVNGNICVFGLLNSNTAAVGSCGVIELQERSHIDINGGLYVFGYIINPQGTKVTDENMHLVGKITANSGAEVREVLQMRDWRGGNATSGMISAKNVFPINQYYVQNIEAPITLKEGSKEILTTAVSVTFLGTMVAHPKFILPLNDGQEGFFLMGPATSLTKYYDWANDRLKYIVKGEPTIDIPNPIAKISSMNISMSSYNIESANFVLPITNNIDIRVTNMTVNLPNPMCILAGGTLTVDDNAKVFVNGTSNKVASCYVYDKEWNTKNGEGTGAGYFGTSNASILLLDRRPGAFETPRRTIKDDASLIINGLVEIGQYGALYTTAEGSDGYTYGANITSTGSGRIKFVNIGTGTITQQVTQTDKNTKTFNIPVSSARLKNSDGTFVHTNSNESTGKSYIYIDGFWQIPTWVLPTINITLPTQVFTGTIDYPITDYDKNDNWEATLSGDGFTFDGTKKTITLKHNDEMGNNITLPIHYTAQNKHGDHGATITLTNTTKSEIYSTPITATEDYTPIFNVTPTDIHLGETYINTPIPPVGVPTFQITPQSNANVTSLHNNDTYYSRLKWEVISIKNSSDNSDNTDFTFTLGEGKNALSGAKITFNSATPGTQSVKITLRATYTDASSPSQQIKSEDVIINVTATAKALEANNFTLTDECEQELKNMCVGIPVTLEFKDLTLNTEPLTFDIANNGAVGSKVLTLSGEGTDEEPYTIIANSVPAVMPTITISQESDGIYVAHTTTYTTQIRNCTPEVQWNWSDMYFGKTYNNPITTNSTGAYTLTLKSVTKNGSAVTVSDVITYNAENKTATVKSNLSGEYIATFEFVQEAGDAHIAYSQTFTANIYQDPSVLPLCVESERIFTAVTSTSTGEVTYNINQIDFSENATWTMTFIGIPDVLSFTPTANTQLTIEQREEGGSFGTVFYQTVEAGTNYQVELAPATKYVKFTVVNATSLSSLCLTALNRVRLEPQILYMPIAKDPENAPTTRTITATYVNRSMYDLNLISSVGEITASPNKLEPTAEGQYKVVNITISSKATSEFDAFVSVKYSNNEQAQVDIETYRFPQKLPIQLEQGKDKAKRFHFVTTAYKNTEWDAAQYAIKMQNKTTAEADRPFVTFAFDGAPSFISFVPLVATDIADWKIVESKDGLTPGEECSGATLENGVLKQTLTYTTRYVRVTYVGNNPEVVQMTKVNILSDKSAIPNPEELELTDANKYVDNRIVGKDLNLTVVNLTNLSVAIDNDHFTLSYGAKTPATTFELDANDIDNVFGEDVVGAIPFKVFWNASQATDFGNIIFTTKVDGVTRTLATVPLVGTKAGISEEDVIYTGVKTGYTLDGKFEGIYGLKDEIEKSTAYRKVDLSSTYDSNAKPLFDYLIIYGETTTTDGTTNITTPTTTAGSNAKTPMYIYYKDGDSYKFWTMEENVNTANKAISSLPIAKGQQLRIYITGFCPYATTGYTKEDEGVWYFQGVNGAKLDIYLEDCYIYSRHKTLEGRAFSGRYDGQAFSEGYVRGSGGVLVFENQDNDQGGSFDVTIHTRRNNMFKSNYGCFFELMQGMRAYNVSSPIQVHLASDKHKANSITTLTFDDKWPTDASYSNFVRTNGYLSLQKQVNNAPSIDLGNANTIVNFKGGQVELQNAAVVSPNYKTTFAISFRSGLMAGFPMAYGIGTDDVGGTVKFYDGTTTVIPMEVDIKFRDYYLMDTDANGKELSTTSCLRTPTNTFVYGGSHCMMRACEDVTSKGGAPTRNDKPLGLYKYPKTKPASGRGGFGEMNAVGLVTPTDIPTGYQAESVTPNTNGTLDTNDDYLNFWFSTEDEPSVTPEVDKKINFWKACMTQISAEYMSYGGTVGGETMILSNEENKYLLYCQIDENISNVISAGTGFGEDRKYTYMAPVKDPTGQLATPYLSIPPSYVGEEYQNYIETVDKENNEIITGEDYTVSEKVYYVVPTTADTWMTFTAPFNVEKLYIVEAYEEAKLAATPLKEITDAEGNTTILNKRQSVLLEQAKHNADFAAFFGVAMALGRDQTFEQIHQDYEGWAKYVDKKENTRGKIKLEHYNGNNFFTANYYLYHNAGEWTRNGDKFDTKWEVVGEVAEGEILMRQGETYSMLFPYCTGCDVQKDPEGNIIVDANGLPQLSAVRDYWDYWSGKFLIFESTQASSKNPHTIKGSNYHEQLFAPAKSGNGSAAVLTGNSTFALMTSNENVDNKVYTYSALMGRENFENNSYDDGYGTMLYQQIQPTVSFLIADIPSKAGARARNVMRSGEIIYDKENTPTDNNLGGNIPTVGGGNDLFITSTATGINIAVAEPQQVRVLSSTGAVLYSGMVQTAVDVFLPTTGVYVITGENEVHKILH